MLQIVVRPIRKEEQPSAPPATYELTEVEVKSFAYKNRDIVELTKKYDTADDPDDYTHTQVYKAFYPLMLSLRLVGLHHHRKIDKSKKGISMPNFSQIYSWSLTVAAWIVVIKSVTTMRLAPGIGPEMFTYLIYTLVIVLCAMNCTAFLLASHNTKSKRKLFLCYAKLKMYGGPFVDAAKIRKNIFIGTIIAWVGIVSNFAIVVFIVFGTNVLTTLSADPFIESQTGSIVMKIIFICEAFYMSSMFIFGAFVDLCISLLLFYEFKLFRKNFRSLLSKDGTFKGSLENERRRYLLMARVVDAANDCMAIHHGASFSCGIANICLLLYSIIYYPNARKTFGVVFAYSFWIIGALFDMVVSCTCGILVNASVRIISKIFFK